MKYRIQYFLHVQGMEFPDQRDFGELDASSPEDAVESAIKIHFPNYTGKDLEYLRGCLSATYVEAFPHHFHPRTDDVILVKKDDIPVMARRLCNRVSYECNVNPDDMWKEYGALFVNDINVILGLPMENEDEDVI